MPETHRAMNTAEDVTSVRRHPLVTTSETFCGMNTTTPCYVTSGNIIA